MATQPQTRSTLKHLLNVSMPFVSDKGTGTTENKDVVWALICNGVTELTEEFNPDTDDIQYICDKVKTTIMKSYKPSFEVEMHYQLDSKIQNYFNIMSRKLPINGKDNEIEYIRYNENEKILDGSTGDKYIGVLRSATVQFTSIGGSAEDPLGSAMTINAKGTNESSEKVGYVEVFPDDSSSPKYVWHLANIDIPYMTGYTTYIESTETVMGMSTYKDGQSITVSSTGSKFKIIGKSKNAKGKYVKLFSKNTNVVASTTSAEIPDTTDGEWEIELTKLASGTFEFSLAIVDAATGTQNLESVTTNAFKLQVL